MNIRTIPWITTEAFNFLKSIIKPNFNILEFGCGGSTIWFAKQNVKCITIEHNIDWYNIVTNYLIYHQLVYDIRLLPRPYYHICDTFINEYFDIILIDGRDRIKCLLNSINKLKHGGIIMLDNSERIEYADAFIILKEWETINTQQIEPDQTGFIYSGWQTSWWRRP